MPQSPEKSHDVPAGRKPADEVDELDLDLPALDGEGDEPAEDAFAFDDGRLDEAKDEAERDFFDDATGEGGPHDDFVAEGVETGWLDGAETAGSLDLGPSEVAFNAEEKVLEDDEADLRHGLDDLVPGDETAFVADAGEEGPLAEDEELREEDLPALDADDDGDVPDEHLFDRGLISADEDLRWADRAWARVPVDTAGDEADDSGILAIPGEDAGQTARDAVWKRLEESGRAMAAAFVPGDSVLVAVSTPDRARALLVRIQPDGEVRIIAEIDPLGMPASTRSPSSTRSPVREDDGEPCVVTFLRWDAARGCLFVGGNFGVEAYRPA